MNFLSAAIEEYCESHTEQETDLQRALNRETYADVLSPRMLSGHMQGRFLSMISRMIRPDRILEVGTFTGYSALCLAEGLSETGKIITIDWNEELESMARRYFNQSPYADKIDYRIGNAREVIPGLTDIFDLIFIDADKLSYLAYYHMCLPKLRKGGFIIADNVLWSGKVVQRMEKTDKDTQALLDFNRTIQEDPSVSNILIPIRDGLMVLQKL